jgi:thiamine biosynthesis protein ThiS
MPTLERAPDERTAAVTVTVNGEARRLPAGATVASLLATHGLDPRLVVVEHNRTILRDRSALGAVALADGDVVELVHFVGGG